LPTGGAFVVGLWGAFELLPAELLLPVPLALGGEVLGGRGDGVVDGGLVLELLVLFDAAVREVDGELADVGGGGWVAARAAVEAEGLFGFGVVDAVDGGAAEVWGAGEGVGPAGDLVFVGGAAEG
jgi:hypothetical protein